MSDLDLPKDFFIKTKEYFNILKKWSKVHNITKVNDNNIEYYIEDSIYPLSFLKDFKSLLDIGSGAGFPAIFLALAREDINFVLLEPLAKKSSFLHYVKSSLFLKNVEIIKDRVENFEYRYFDVISSRALTNVKDFMSISNKFISNNRILLYKGAKS